VARALGQLMVDVLAVDDAMSMDQVLRGLNSAQGVGGSIVADSVNWGSLVIVWSSGRGVAGGLDDAVGGG
jgi:hypothetical protein